jgi:CRISPR system Cascade subunit CasA
VERWIAAFDHEVDAGFFDDGFWAEVAGEGGAHDETWRKRLVEIARAQFWQAVPAAPRTEMRRQRAIARAEAMLEGGLRRFEKEAGDD